MYDVYINGVGSNVVCSTISGNAKASVRGTDNKQFPRLFMCELRLGSKLITQKRQSILIKSNY